MVLGSDQHVLIDMLEEARALEMDERLASQQRGRFCPADLVSALTVDGQRSIGWPDAGESHAGTSSRSGRAAARLATYRRCGSGGGRARRIGRGHRHRARRRAASWSAAVYHRLGDVGELLSDAIGALWSDQ